VKAPIGATRGVRGETGAVFVQVGIAILVLMSFNVFVLDYGIMWMSRRQAQNAADAGAFAGAIARNYDDFDDPPSGTGPAAESATQAAAANLIWQEPGISAVSFGCPTGITGRCVRVDVFRNISSGNPLPTMFGPLLGVTAQGVRATATAQAVNANATNCLRPFAFPDEWVENRSPNDEFNRYFESGPSAGTLLDPDPANVDAYVAPDGSQATFSTNLADLGDRIDFRLDRPPLTNPIVSGFLLPLNLPGTSTYLEDIAACNGQLVALREQMPLAPAPAAGSTYAALQALLAQDPGATWNFATHTIGNSCAPECAAVSPRLIAVALFDPDQFQLRRATADWSGCPTAGPCVTIANIAAVFIHRLSGGSGHGHLVRYPGLSITTAPTFVDQGSWLVTTTLIR
jgi:hypothetical protein